MYITISSNFWLSILGRKSIIAMKPFLVAVLVVVVCVEQVHSMWCFRCDNEPSNFNCLQPVKCAERDQYCLTTTQYSGPSNNSVYKLSKKCSEVCPDIRLNVQPGEPETKCCSFSYCNISGATSVQTSVVLGVLVSFFYIFRSAL